MEECFPKKTSPPPPLPPLSEADDIIPTDYLSISMGENKYLASPTTTPLHCQIEHVKHARFCACNFKDCCKVYKSWSSFRSLFRHKKMHEGRSYVCHFCEKKFHSSNELSFHQSSVCESAEKVYKCNPCNEAYTDVCAYNFHNQKHEAYIRPKCQTVCQTKFSLKNHSCIHNNNIGSYCTCNISSAQYI